MRHLILLFITLPFFSLAQNVQELRDEYPKASLNSEVADMLSLSVANVSENDAPTLTAYKGALLTIKAKFAKSIKDKKSNFKQGVTLLEASIKRAPENIEIRCLRMGVQENSPKFLKYKSSIEGDKKFLIDNYSTLKNKEIKDFIKGYVKISKLFTDAEKQLF